jgi:glutathione S-transferase
MPIRGRGEPIRLLLEHKHVEYEDKVADRAGMKTDLDTYHFGQVPVFEDNGYVQSQSNAIMRHLGRKYDMYGSNEREMQQVDELVDGIEAIKQKYLGLIYGDNMKGDSVEKYYSSYIDPDTKSERNGGAHFFYIDRLVKKTGKDGFAVGNKLTIADILLFDLVDFHVRIFNERFEQTYPDLTKHHKKISGLPGIQEYLNSEKRKQPQNGNSLG